MKDPKSQSEPENIEKSISKEHEEDEVEDELPIDSDADDEVFTVIPSYNFILGCSILAYK